MRRSLERKPVQGLIPGGRWAAVPLLWVLLAGAFAPALAWADPEDPDDELLIIEDDEGDPTLKVNAPFLRLGELRGGLTHEIRKDLKHEPGEYVFELHGRLDLETRVDFSPNLRATLGGRFRYFYMEQETVDGANIPFTGGVSRWHSESEIRDMVLSWTLGSLNLRIGNQVLAWGRTDFARPLDVMNPYDYRDGLVAGQETPAVPVPMLRLDWRVSERLSLQLAYAPFFAPHRMTSFGSDTAPGQLFGDQSMGMLLSFITDTLHPSLWDEAQPLVQASRLPSHPIYDAQTGASVLLRLGAVDLSLHYAYVHDRYPETKVDADLALVTAKSLASGFDPNAFVENMNDPAFRAAYERVQERGADFSDLMDSRYRRTHMAGLSVETTLGGFGLRSDAAWFSRRNLYTQDFTPYSAPALAWALGMDYVYEDSFDVLLELSEVFILDDGTPPLLIVDRPWGLLFTGIRWRLLDDRSLHVSLGGMLGLSDFDWSGRAEVRYVHRSRHAFSVGVQIGRGPLESLGGWLERNDMAVLKYEWML